MEYMLILVAFVVLLALASYSLTIAIRQKNRIDRIFSSRDKHLDLEKLLNGYVDDHKLSMERIEKIYSNQDSLVKQVGMAMQKTGLVRFNPFSDTGGDQSFALALLDANDNGIILTAIHGREGTRIYTKSVEYGNCSHSLSSEETAALTAAVKTSNKQ